MSTIASTIGAAPWIASIVGLALSVSIIAALIALTWRAGLYYSIPRMILKGIGQAALNRS
jgi:hypothetical protein